MDKKKIKERKHVKGANEASKKKNNNAQIKSKIVKNTAVKHGHLVHVAEFIWLCISKIVTWQFEQQIELVKHSAILCS